MYDLLTRTISQGLQAFLPIAFAVTWFRRHAETAPVTGLRWGVAAALPATAVAGYLFQASSRQAQWEAALATATLPVALWFARRVWQGVPSSRMNLDLQHRHIYRVAFALFAVLLIVRQTMEITVAFAAAVELRARDPLLAITMGAAVALVLSAVWLRIGSRLPKAAVDKATGVFGTLFVAQLAMYALHESSEARLLPWSDVLHAATEPYGPDGIYGRYVSAGLFVLPLTAAVAMLLRVGRRQLAPIVRWSAVAAALIIAIVGGIKLISNVSGDVGASHASGTPAPSSKPAVAIIAASPHLLFRHTAVDQSYSRLSATPLDRREPAARTATDLSCERVSYAAGRGICLSADRGVFTSYKAMLFDGTLRTTQTLKLAGSPSRTRVSSDGRVGAITVFAAGAAHGYAGSKVSTKTTIIDMATGDELADLEQFTTWRNGTRFKAADFNFWGVTFARDSNVFYATLRTAGTTYLVRGDLGLRKLTVLRDNVECPSLSPDNSLIAFKKKVGTGLAPWRLYILDLATLTDRAITVETRSIDDQIEWLDGTRVLYAAPRSAQSASSDVWVAPIDNGAAPRIFLPDAESPIVVR